jgi:pantetheine-phosphate adenylyltransferase
MPTTERRIAVCPGTYDPVTLGHIDVITRASKLFDEIIVAVVNASVRKSKALFTTEERMGFIEEATKDIENVRVEPFDVLVVEFARRNEAVAIVKGLRAISDFEYEVEMAQLNRLQDATVESVFIMASPQYSFLSSSGVKELAIFGADISELVPAHVAGPLQEALAR